MIGARHSSSAACRRLSLILSVEPGLEPLYLGREFLKQGIQRADIEFQIIRIHLHTPVAQFSCLPYRISYWCEGYDARLGMGRCCDDAADDCFRHYDAVG